MGRSDAVRTLLVIADSMGATAQIRGRQYEELFRASGRFRVTYGTRKPAWFGAARARLESRWWSVAAARALGRYESRANEQQEQLMLSQARNTDLVYLLRTPSWRFHRELWKQQRAKIVMDLNDGLWLPHYRDSGYAQLDEMLRHSHAVVCESEALAAYARRHNANVHIVPDAPQVEEFDRRRARHRPPRDRLTLGWIGGPVAVDNLSAIFEPLEELFRRHHHLHLRVLGADATRLPRFEHVRFSCKSSYSSEEMVEEALCMDVGLFPLFRTEDSITRGTLKARIYMSAGAVAACQDWGGNRDLIQHRVNGVLAGSAADWLQSLEWLVLHPEERAAIASRGLETIRCGFTRQMSFDKLVAAFDSL